MKLHFEPHRYQRSMTREEWYQTYRWVRQTRKELQTLEQQTLAAALVCPVERIKRAIMESIVFPPLLIVPDVEANQAFDLRPGSICYVK